MARKGDILDRTGETSINKYGNKMSIIKYKDSSNIVVEFENGYKTENQYNNFKIGNIKSPYDKSSFDIGYIGEGEYKCKINGKDTIQYNYWRGMLRRCYDKKALLKRPTYEDKYVCNEWHCFQTFAKWFDANYYTIQGQTMDLDKDILFKGNKVYSPNACVFLPHRINTLMVNCNSSRGDYPVGVSYNVGHRKFNASCNIYNKDIEKSIKINLGYFDSSSQAFYDGYKPFKEDYIKKVAEEYKDRIPNNVYDAMYKWIVSIDD